MWLLRLCSVSKIKVIVKVSMTVENSIYIFLSHSVVNTIEKMFLIKIRMYNFRQFHFSFFKVFINDFVLKLKGFVLCPTFKLKRSLLELITLTFLIL